MLLVVAVILALWPLFERLAPLAAGRDQRFLDRGIAVAALPDPVLPSLCDAVGASVDPALAAALCGNALAARAAPPPPTFPGALGHAAARASQAFARPLQEAEERALAVRGSPGLDGDDVLASTDALAAIDADIAPFRARFQPRRRRRPGAARLRAARRRRRLCGTPAGRRRGRGARAASLARRRAPARRRTRRSPRDGRTRGRGAAAAAPAAPGCGRIADSLAATAALMADARQSVTTRARTKRCARSLRSAGDQWAAAMALGFVFVVWSRRAVAAPLGVAAALAAWAGAAWVGPRALAVRQWPRTSYLARAGISSDGARRRRSSSRSSAPPRAVGRRSLRPHRPPATRPAPIAQAMSSRIGYPGFVVATGTRLADPARPLARRPCRQPLPRALSPGPSLAGDADRSRCCCSLRRAARARLAWRSRVGGEAVQRASRRVGAATRRRAARRRDRGAVLAFGIVLANMRQLTSELGRIWLIVGAAWFFFLRAGPLTERLARIGPALRSRSFATPGRSLFVVGVLVAAMFATRDMGPLLIAGYAAGAFVAAALAMWWHHRSGHAVAAVRARAALSSRPGSRRSRRRSSSVGAYDSVTASRLESVAAPFASINDQLALVSWFQRAAPLDGFGLGTAPWCGFAAARACSGVPAQIHSDYTFTALVGVFGPLARLGGLGRHGALAAPPDPPPRPRHARRAAPGRQRRPARQRRPGAAELARRRLGRAHLVPARGHGRRQPRRAAAHRRDVSLRQLRHDLAAGQRRVPRALPQRRPAAAAAAHG